MQNGLNKIIRMFPANFTGIYYLLPFLLTLYVTPTFGQSMTGPYWLYDNHYLVDKYVINPAFAGNQYYPKAFISTQRMNLQLQNSPAIHITGVHSRLGISGNYPNTYKSNDRSARNAAGGLIFADNNGPYQTIGAKLDYAYYIPLDRNSTALSFGLGGMLFSKRIKLDRHNSSSINDPLIAENIGKKVIIPDFNAGVAFFHHQFYTGFSVSQLLENSYRFAKYNYTPTRVYRNYYLFAGYRFIFNNLEVETSLVAGHNFASKRHSNNGNFVDANVECFLKPLVFIMSYRINGYITTALLYRTQKLELGVHTELFSTNSSDARLNSIALMASYSFLPSKTIR
jgi:type IX secretion system PorP/SprF family membrane protein